jgi:hypothetical protein
MVEVRDFMEQCAIHEIDSPAFVQNKTAAEVIQLILAEMSIQPLSTEYNTCEDTFFSAFENQSLKLNPLVEIGNACTSEFGYAYIRHDSSSYEKFIVEGRKTRTGIASATTISVSTPIELCGYLLKEDGGKFQLEDSSGYIKLDEATVYSAGFDNEQYDAVIENGNDLYNSIGVNSIPKTVGTSVEPLYLNTTPIPIFTNGTTISGTVHLIGSVVFDFDYKDYSSDNFYGLSYINPVGTTDYRLYANSQGTGTYYYTQFVTVTSQNNNGNVSGTIYVDDYPAGVSSYTFYIFDFQVRGTALRVKETETNQFQGSASINQFGKSTLDIDMPYQIGTAIPASIAGTLLTQYQDPVTRTENIMFFANKDINMLSAYLVLDIGDRFTYQETVSGVNSDYFINGVTFEIYANNIIKFGYKTKAVELEVF